MIKSILAGLVALGVVSLCDKPKPDPFAGKINLIKVDGVSCGFFDAMESDGTTLHITGLTFRKDQIPLIWSGGFVVKPAQRIGFVVDAEGEIHENVWVEYMDPYSEQQDSITIARMECFVENQEERPEQEGQDQRLLSQQRARQQDCQRAIAKKELQAKEITINIMVKNQIVGTITSLDIKEGKPLLNSDMSLYPTFTAHRVSFSRERVAEAFNSGFVSRATQILPLQIEIKQSGETIMQLHNCWVDNSSVMEDAVSPLMISHFSGQCEEVDRNPWKK